jgi:allophanate hydrolase subunit 2
MTALIVRSCGPMTSLQDNGRIGQGRYGISRSGAMDRLALAAANALVGNEPGSAAVEIMLVGGSFALAEGGAYIALAGAPFSASLDGAPLAPFTATVMQAGQTLTIGSAASGIFAYLAVSGGFALEPDLGSLSLQRQVTSFRSSATAPPAPTSASNCRMRIRPPGSAWCSGRRRTSSRRRWSRPSSAASMR